MIMGAPRDIILVFGPKTPQSPDEDEVFVRKRAPIDVPQLDNVVIHVVVNGVETAALHEGCAPIDRRVPATPRVGANVREEHGGSCWGSGVPFVAVEANRMALFPVRPRHCREAL